MSSVNTVTEHEAQSADTVENHLQSPLRPVQSLTQEEVGQEQRDSGGVDDVGRVTAGQEEVVLGEEADDDSGGDFQNNSQISPRLVLSPTQE